MAEDKTLYVIFGIVAVIALVAMVFMIAPQKVFYSNGNAAGQAFGTFDLSAIQSRFGGGAQQPSGPSTPEYLGPPVSADDWQQGNFQGNIGAGQGSKGLGLGGSLQKYDAPLKNCVRGAADEIKGNVQSQCDPRTCIDSCSASYGNDQEGLKACAQGCMEDFKSCTTQYKSDFNTKVRSCASEYAPDPINSCTDECDASTTTLREFTDCSSTCIRTNWVDPTKDCIEQCKTSVGDPTTQEAAAMAKDQFTQCANTCLADFDQYLN